MNVLVINGSPKGERSNTMHLTRAFLEGAKWIEAEIIDISKLSIKSCCGCYSCWSATPGKCVINDDMKDILPKIIKADVIIWSFPLYGYFFPGYMKIFNDRLLPLSLPEMNESAESGEHPLRYDLSRQRHVYISTCGFWTANGNYDTIINLLERISSKQDYKTYTIFCGQGELFNIPELKEQTSPYLDIVRCAGEEFVSGNISKETRDLLLEPLLPKDVFEKMANGSWGD